MYRNIAKNLLLCIASVALVSTVHAAGKAPGAAAKAATRAENPSPFGLVFGKTTTEEALALLQKEGGTVTKSGNRVIKDEIANPEVEGYFLDGISIEGVSTTRVWFLNGVLMRMTYELSGSFEPFNDQLTARYGKSATASTDFGGERHAAWNFKDIELSLDRPFMGGMTMDYIHGRLWRQARESDTRVYAEVTKAKGQKQKGF